MFGTIDLKVRLEAKVNQDGDAWIACCPPLDLYTQSDTKDSAMEHLQEAVLAWFESCMERGVLTAALEEVGFQRIQSRNNIQVGASVVHVASPSREPSLEQVEISIPAYIAAAMGSQHAPC